MKLGEVLKNVAVKSSYDESCEISSIAINSQKMEQGGLFIALSGKSQDGKKYIPDAIKNGAKVIAYDGEYSNQSPSSVAFVELGGDMRANIAKIAHNFYPQTPALISAVTGTNGKTSIADFTRQMMTFLGHHSASIGTIGVVSDVMENLETLTTPDSITLHQILNRLAKSGVDYVSMEASSVGIEQHRMDNIKIKTAGFTNLTQDHLDYHLDMQNYFNAKKLLFSHLLAEDGIAVLNADVEQFAELKSICEQRKITVWSYGKNGQELKLQNTIPQLQGQIITISAFGQEHTINLPLIGHFQAMNVLCALGMVCALNNGFDKKLLEILPKIKGACGRLDFMGSLPNGATVYVDYAHTPDALENVLKTMRHHTQNNLWVLFGCGGDRDKLKRPIMGEIAAQLADKVVITDDNPRTEDAAQIRREIMAKCPHAVEIGDRIKAIEYAISQLQSGDMLVLAGKGHETGQKIGDTTIPMSDINEAKRILSAIK